MIKMNLRSQSTILMFLLLFTSIAHATPVVPFTKMADGIIIYPAQQYPGSAHAVRLQVINNSIIRVTASPAKEMPQVQSLVTIYPTTQTSGFTITNTANEVRLATPFITAVASLQTGAVAFFDKAGKQIIAERAAAKQLLPVTFEGQRSYNIIQTFETKPGDAIYGLGQHQDDVYNYMGQQVTMFQNNTEVAIPFLVSPNNYGILWDNYSITKAGDVREYLPLSSLQLFAKTGEEGWLTASYANDKTKSDDVVLTRAETTIDMEFVNDSKLKLPAEFKTENGSVTWQGSIASSFSGNHKMRFTYGGYLKVWLNNKLVLDRWRRAWNPAPALLDVAMQKGQKQSIKIEWIPEGSESYISLKWQEPVPTADANTFSFSSEAGKHMDYYFVYGKNIDEVISGYRTLTGKAPIVPKWAMGFWQSRERYKTQEELLNVVAEFRKRKIPLDNIVLDWFYWKENDWGSQEFDAARFPSPDSMIKVLHNQYNTKLMISVWPKFYEGIPAYNDFNKRGWLYKRNIADRQKDWVGPGYTSTFYDAFNPEARKAFWNLIHSKIYTKGIDAWWMDASEPDLLSNVSPQRRKEQMTPVSAGLVAEYVNAYPLQNAKGIYEGQRSVDNNKRVFLLTRSGFAGSQRYAAAIWSGDIGARWHDMKAQIAAGVNFSMSGLPYWTMDIGGFVVENRYERPTATDTEEWRELNTRWFQFGAFTPLFRVHGQYPFREVFNIAPEDHPAYKSMVYYNRLRYRLLPYIYSLAGASYHNNYTMMRGLVMDFAADKKVHSIGDQYMFGPSLLINPVYEYKERRKQLYLPAGSGWYDLYSGKYFAGGQSINVDAPYETMPVFVKEGSIIPFGPELQYTSEKRADTITLFVYTGRDASFNLYEDEDVNYNYEKGQYSNISFTYNEKTKQLTIGERKGSFNGMLTNRTFRVIWVNKNAAKPLDFEQAAATTVRYNGSAVKVTQSNR
ncbi:glycoside hydrolase family 31 protein [Aridibaculum aurantiacum]|uniref:glycoside hydrolase family 31 protein n=1 Tax=Aridibaculum aurantiacum TaxID=2810307 RepID=UPI001F60C0E2|nr:TIM-barrel domain-containing protein [Aridibaculum aurantiacum]